MGWAGSCTSVDNETFEQIYASHVVEHLDYKDELVNTLSGWRRDDSSERSGPKKAS